MADKKRTEPDWQDLKTFLALGRHGSLSAAARALRVNHATISRRIRALEASLGEKLVDRRPEGYALTPAGNEALAAASEMETAAQTLGRLGGDGPLRGMVRISAPPGVAHGFLIERLARLAALHPGLDIDLSMDIRAVSLERHQADIAIRLSKPADGDVIARPLLAIGYGLYGTPEMCAAVEAGGEPVFVGFDEADAYVPDAQWLARTYPQARVAFRAGNQFAQAIAVKAGAGMGLLPHYIGRADNALRLWRDGGAPPPREAYLLIRRRDRQDAVVRTAADLIGGIFTDARGLFE